MMGIKMCEVPRLTNRDDGDREPPHDIPKDIERAFLREVVELYHSMGRWHRYARGLEERLRAQERVAKEAQGEAALARDTISRLQAQVEQLAAQLQKGIRRND